MPDTQRLKIKFEGLEHGWLTVTLSFGEKEYTFSPSHVPYDSINELALALLKLLDGYAKAKVRWSDEPVEHEFLFDSKGEQVSLKVYEIAKSVVDGKVRHEVFAYGGSMHEVIHPMWKGMRDMESKQSHKEYERQWRKPFPEHEMRELTRRIKASKLNDGVPGQPGDEVAMGTQNNILKQAGLKL